MAIDAAFSGGRRGSVRPNLIFIGPSKAGSSWLFEMLRQHPDIFLATAKDLYFFDRYFDRGLCWYESHFRDAVDYKVIGEFSHDYLLSERAAGRIRATLPNVRLLAILRNPVQRAFSEYLFLKRNNLIGKNVGIQEAAKRFPAIVSGGMYGEHLEVYCREFAEEQMFIGEFEDIVGRPRELLAGICRFLGIDAGFSFSDVERRVLPAATARSAVLAGIAKGAAVQFRKYGLVQFLGVAKRSTILQSILYRPYDLASRPKLSDSERAWLEELYQPDLRRLETLLQRSFRHWY